MKQVLFWVPGLGLPVYGFGLLLVAAVLAGTRLAASRMRTVRLDPGLAYDLSTFAVVVGLAGARLLYVLEYWGETVRTVGEALRVWDGGLVFYGGAIGGVAGVLLFRAFRPFPVLATLDALAPSLALGLAIGRVGCFLNGCCYGEFCPFPALGVSFPRDSPPWRAALARGVIPPDAGFTPPVHATQLYSSLDGLVLLALLSSFYPLRRRDGEVAALLMMAYPATRFMIERFRDDEAPLVSGFTIAQAASFFVLAAGVLFWSRLSRRPAVRFEDGDSIPSPVDK
jgi:phosphatidylglycerol---prolipoprotein diacylglyceryl transferase